MEKRILAVLIAALAGGAYAQTYQNSNTAPAQKATAPQPAGATAGVNNPPPSRGYIGSGAGVVATNPYGLCWRSGADWSPDKAAAPCDAVPRASVPPAPIAQAPEPAAAPAPLAAAAGSPRTRRSPGGRGLPGLPCRRWGRRSGVPALGVGGLSLQVVLVGHADRIGSEEYNQELSEKRAQAVADYLAQKGVDSSRLQVEGRGKSEPITGNECSKLGAENNKNQKLIACLQPDRRVDAELLGSRESTASTSSAPASAGATSSGSSTGSAGGSSSEAGAANTK